MTNALFEYLVKDAAWRPVLPGARMMPTLSPISRVADSGGGAVPLTPAAPMPPAPPGPDIIEGMPLHAREMEMWKEWKKSGHDPKKLEPLQASLEKIVFRTVSRYRGVDIPPRLIQAEAEKHLIEALKDYNPNSGAKLSTHLINRQMRVDRFVKEHQNLARIVESRAQKWGDYQASKQLLVDELGRDPTSKELSRAMSTRLKRSVTPAEAERFMREDRRDLVHTGLDETSFENVPTQDRLVIKMVEEELSREEKAVYERLFGLNGAPKQKPGEIARALKMHPSKVSRITAAITKKLEAYY
jgi:DNA-directed RNA polymerase specialized sigma subunit